MLISLLCQHVSGASFKAFQTLKEAEEAFDQLLVVNALYQIREDI